MTKVGTRPIATVWWVDDDGCVGCIVVGAMDCRSDKCAKQITLYPIDDGKRYCNDDEPP